MLKPYAVITAEDDEQIPEKITDESDIAVMPRKRRR